MTRKFSGDTLVLATHNPGKVAEIAPVLAARGIKLVCAADLNLPEPAETGTTFLENALIKARAAVNIARMPVLAEDSGLCVAALNDAPGVYTADWLGHPRRVAAGINRVLLALRDQPDRRAYFTATMILMWPDGHYEVATGRVDGTITPCRAGQAGHGYDPIFRPLGHAQTFAEMGIVGKAPLSHRARALANLMKDCF